MSAIIVADPHTLCREALCGYIRHAGPDIVIHECTDYSSLWDCIRLQIPDFILIDLALPGSEAGITLQDFSAVDPKIKVGAMVSEMQSVDVAQQVFHGIFPKNLSSKAILSGIQDVLAGGHFFPDAREIISDPQSKPRFKEVFQDFNLTNREKEVLTHLVKGASNKDIARALNLQVVTVKLHVRGICRKTQAANRTQAAIIAKENGWG